MPAAASAAPISACGCCWKATSREAARIAAELDRLNSERRVIEQAAEAQAEAEALAVARPRGQGRCDRHGIGRLASRRRRPGGVAAEGKIRPAGLRDRAGARRHRHRLGPLHPRRRSRQGGAAGRDRRPAAEGRRPCHGGGRDAAQGAARGIPRLHGKRARATMSRSRATPTSSSSMARSARAR